MGGLGALLPYLGGGGMLHRADAYPIRHGSSRYAALNTHGGVIASNRKESALYRTILRTKRTYRT